MPSSTMFDPDKLAKLAAEKATEYREARPFPHIVIDDFLPESVLDEVLEEFPRTDEESWWRFDSDRERKLASTDVRMMGSTTASVLAQLNSAPFIDFLTELTGITGLVPDPHFFGGGLHQIEQGGFLNVHVDFNLHPVTRLERRLNLLLYLNRGWQDEWGGSLELWDRDMTRCEMRIPPVFNRCVIFTTSEASFHGHPAPVQCPSDVTRRSLALYYYSVPEVAGVAHNTVFQEPSIHSTPKERAKAVLKDLAPPVLLRWAKRVRQRRRASSPR